MKLKNISSRFRRKKAGVLIKMLFLLLIMVLSFTVYTASGVLNKEIYKGVYIDNKPVGGMKKEEAIEHLYKNNRRSTESFQLTLTYDKFKWTLGHADIDGVLKIDEAVEKAYSVGREGGILNSLITSRKIKKQPIDINTTYSYNKDKLIEKLESIGESIAKKAVDATIEFKPDDEVKFIITPEEKGLALNIDSTISKLDRELAEGNIKPVISIDTVEVVPKVKSKDLEQLTNCISVFSTDLSASTEDRTHNIVLSAKAFNGMVVKPGETVSFNQSTGERSLKKGYKNAPAIMPDKSYADVPGGGVCQTSTTLYNAVLRAGLEIIELQRHSLPSSYIDLGLDATVNLPSPEIDFKFRNNFDTPVFIRSFNKDNRIYFEIYGKQLPNGRRIEIRTEEYETVPAPEPEYIEDKKGEYVKYKDETFEKVKSRNGFKVRVYKDLYEGDKLIDSQLIDDHYYHEVKGIIYIGTQDRPSNDTDNTQQNNDTIIIKNIKKLEY